jgi:hypothetical protein
MQQGFCSMPQPNTTGAEGGGATGTTAGGATVGCYAGGPRTGLSHLGRTAGLGRGMQRRSMRTRPGMRSRLTGRFTSTFCGSAGTAPAGYTAGVGTIGRFAGGLTYNNKRGEIADLGLGL